MSCWTILLPLNMSRERHVLKMPENTQLHCVRVVSANRKKFWSKAAHEKVGDT